MSWWNALIAPITNLVSKPLEQWGDRKKVKLEAKFKIEQLKFAAVVRRAEADIEMAKAGQKIEGDWDARAQEQMKFSWKDEVLLLIIVSPFVGSFIPGIQGYVDKGWGYVAKAPEWYMVAFLGVYAAVFGLRWLVAPLVNKLTKGKSNAIVKE